MLNSRNICFTAIAGNKDRLIEVPETLLQGAAFHAFLDQPSFSESRETGFGWTVSRMMELNPAEPNRMAKFYKVNPHLIFPDLDPDYSLWMDGNCMLQVPFKVLIDNYLKDADICFFKHPLRDCAYDEAGVCASSLLDDPAKIAWQMQRYKDEGFPASFGLTAGTVILRRHTQKVAEFNDMWWKEICTGSRRDQLSLDYCRWKTGLKFNYFEGFIQPNWMYDHPAFTGSPLFEYRRHEK